MTQELDESRLKALVDTAVDGVILIDSRGQVLMFNPACEKLFGYRSDEVIGRNVNMLMPSPYREEHDRYIHNYRTTGLKKIIGIGREVTGQRKDGTTFPMNLSVGEAKQPNGGSNFVGIIHDLTERKLGEAHRAHLAAIVESSSDAVIGKDLDGHITSWNKGAERIYGYTADDVIGQPITMLAPPERKHEIYDLIERVKRGEVVYQHQTLRLTKDGRLLDISLTLSPIRNAEGKVVGVSTIARDVTQLIAAERRVRELTAELVHTSRLSAMGQLSSSLAHELNQPLTAIMNYTEAARQLLTMAATAPPRVLELLEKASGQAERAGQIIRRLRSFVEKGTVERAPTELNRVVEEAAALATIGSKVDGVQTVYDFAPNLPPLNIDRIQIQQVVVNLVRNAVEILRDAHRRVITIRTRPTDAGEQEVSVADTGPGIPDDIAAKLFTPFVTTKETGMGIGLSISLSIIEAHGGRIWAEPNPEGGAIFRFRIPTELPTKALPASAD
jgi:two-component system, LuxR family, sensor kinase FixL